MPRPMPVLFVLAFAAAFIPAGHGLGMCTYTQTLDRPIRHKGLTLPQGTRLEYVSYNNGGDCEIWFKEPADIGKEPENLQEIILPDDKPLLWGGMPVARIDLSPAYGFEFTLLPAAKPHPQEQHSAFAQKWRQCGGGQQLNLLPDENNWQFARQNHRGIYDCGIQNHDNAAETGFLKELKTLMQLQQQKQ